jgi:hypothetical protein
MMPTRCPTMRPKPTTMFMRVAGLDLEEVLPSTISRAITSRTS